MQLRYVVQVYRFKWFFFKVHLWAMHFFFWRNFIYMYKIKKNAKKRYRWRCFCVAIGNEYLTSLWSCSFEKLLFTTYLGCRSLFLPVTLAIQISEELNWGHDLVVPNSCNFWKKNSKWRVLAPSSLSWAYCWDHKAELTLQLL